MQNRERSGLRRRCRDEHWDAALLSLQACASKGAQHAFSPKSQCSLGSSPVLDSVLGAIGGVSRSFFILHAGRWLDVGAIVDQSSEALPDESLHQGSGSDASTAAGLRHFPPSHVRAAQQREASGKSSLDMMSHDLPKSLESSGILPGAEGLGRREVFEELSSVSILCFQR